MDLSLISKMVGELILDHDTVQLPGLGTFVAEFVPASFSDRGYTVNPPYRKLDFCKDETGAQDNLLADLYSSMNHIDSRDARTILTEFFTSQASALHQTKVLVFPGLGRLRETRDGGYFFISDENLDIYPDAYGLDPVSLKSHTNADYEAGAGMISSLASQIRVPAQSAEPSIPSSGPVESANRPQKPRTVPVSDSSESEKAGMRVVRSDEGYAEKQRRRKTILAVTIAVSVIVVLLVAYVMTARLAPQFIDKILYTPEELSIIYHD